MTKHFMFLDSAQSVTFMNRQKMDCSSCAERTVFSKSADPSYKYVIHVSQTVGTFCLSCDCSKEASLLAIILDVGPNEKRSSLIFS